MRSRRARATLLHNDRRRLEPTAGKDDYVEALASHSRDVNGSQLWPGELLNRQLDEQLENGLAMPEDLWLSIDTLLVET